MKNEIQYQIYIGYNDSQNKREFVSEEEFVGMVTSYFEKNQVGFSLMHCKGGYVYNDKQFILEHTAVITVIGEQNLDIIKFAGGLSMYMNQECLMIVKTGLDTKYT